MIPGSPLNHSSGARPTTIRSPSAVACLYREVWPAFGCRWRWAPNFAEVLTCPLSFPLRVSGTPAPRGWHSPFLPRSVKGRGLQDAPNSAACLPPVRAWRGEVSMGTCDGGYDPKTLSSPVSPGYNPLLWRTQRGTNPGFHPQPMSHTGEQTHSPGDLEGRG